MEMGMWNLLGARGVDVWAFDVFGHKWAKDVRHALCLKDVRFFEGTPQQMPDFSQADPRRDQVFTWNGTTSGAWVEEEPIWRRPLAEGLVICDATSAAFAADLPWAHLDFTALSFQKGLGSEASCGVIVVSARALERLKSHTPPWPIPHILNLREDPLVTHDTMTKSIFAGYTLNTPSMLALADSLWALKWAESIGGLPGLLEKVAANFHVMNTWVDRTPWVDFLTLSPTHRSKTSLCLQLVDPHIKALKPADQWAFLRDMAQTLATEGAAFDCLNHADASPALRLWCGPTVETEDLIAVLPWLEKVFHATHHRWFKSMVEQDAHPKDATENIQKKQEDACTFNLKCVGKNNKNSYIDEQAKEG
jgi:phosphoserine aminotransferase